MKTRIKRTLPIAFTALFAAVLVCYGWVQPTPADDGELQVNRTVVMSRLEDPWDLPKQRMRSIVSGPDGAMYVAIDGGEIWRLERAER